MTEKNITCPKCGRELYADDDVCPFCGYDLKKKKLKTFFLAILFFVVLCGMGNHIYHNMLFYYHANQPPQRIDLNPEGEDMKQAREYLENFRMQYHSSRQSDYNYLAYRYDPQDAEEILRQNEIDYDERAILRAQQIAEEEVFSKERIREELTYYFFTEEQARMASEALQVDWQARAKIAAQKQEERYPHSLSSLLHALTMDGFTQKEASAGIEDMVSQSGKAQTYWKENAYLDAKEEKRTHCVCQRIIEPHAHEFLNHFCP